MKNIMLIWFWYQIGGMGGSVHKDCLVLILEKSKCSDFLYQIVELYIEYSFKRILKS